MTGSETSQMLTSFAHVLWAMEVVGQGFALPIEDVGVISASIRVYEAWLLDPAAKPVAMRDLKGTQSEQKFWQTIFQHISLLFEPRKASGEAVSAPWLPAPPPKTTRTLSTDEDHPFDPVRTHVELCNQVLRIITSATRKLGPSFDQDTWIVMLKVLLGICDGLLREPMERDRRGWMGPGSVQSTSSPVGKEKERDREKDREKEKAAIFLEGDDPGPRMADQMCEELVWVLMEVWLRSRVFRFDMWDHLTKLFVYWTHRVEVIRQWSATILGLTEGVIGLLYGKEGAGNVHLS
ncbi:hypothetical protein HK104_001216, partial [Borealophlyctis nickersoniae]